MKTHHNLFLAKLALTMPFCASCGNAQLYPGVPKPVLSEKGDKYEFSDRLVVMLMSDPQLPMNPTSEASVKKAMDDIVNIPHDFMAVLGDLIQPVGGKVEKNKHYDMYMGESDPMGELFKANLNIVVYAIGHVHCHYGQKDTDGRSVRRGACGGNCHCGEHGPLLPKVCDESVLREKLRLTGDIHAIKAS